MAIGEDGSGFGGGVHIRSVDSRIVDLQFPTLGARYHPTDEDLSLHPSEQKSLAGDPESVEAPDTRRRWGTRKKRN